MHVQVVMSIIGCDRGKMSSHVPAILLSFCPEHLLLAPEVAVAIPLLPAGAAVPCASTSLATFLFAVKARLWLCEFSILQRWNIINSRILYGKSLYLDIHFSHTQILVDDDSVCHSRGT